MDKAAEVLNSPSFILGIVLLFVLFVGGYGLMLWVRRWTEKSLLHPGAESDLEHYRQLRDAGELSEQEYEEICRQLSLRQEQASGEPPTTTQKPTEGVSRSDGPTEPV